MNKAELRKLFLQKRKNLSPNEVEPGSMRIAERFFDFLRQQAELPLTIHLFLSIKQRSEVDTWPIVRRLWTDYPQVNIFVPVTNSSDNTLRHYPLSPQTILIENRWGIPEPLQPDQPSRSSTDFDVVLVPLLAFDRQGQRVGYGGGFYDRFLAECRPDCLKIGLSLFGPVESIETAEPTDINIDMCILPDCVYSFK